MTKYFLYTSRIWTQVEWQLLDSGTNSQLHSCRQCWGKEWNIRHQKFCSPCLTLTLTLPGCWLIWISGAVYSKLSESLLSLTPTRSLLLNNLGSKLCVHMLTRSPDTHTIYAGCAAQGNDVWCGSIDRNCSDGHHSRGGRVSLWRRWGSVTIMMSPIPISQSLLYHIPVSE